MHQSVKTIKGLSQFTHAQITNVRPPPPSHAKMCEAYTLSTPFPYWINKIFKFGCLFQPKIYHVLRVHVNLTIKSVFRCVLIKLKSISNARLYYKIRYRYITHTQSVPPNNRHKKNVLRATCHIITIISCRHPPIRIYRRRKKCWHFYQHITSDWITILWKYDCG